MAILTRRSVLRGTLGIVASGMMARPHLANAAATTATVWWTQGFAEEEDVAFKKIVADYEKASGSRLCRRRLIAIAAGGPRCPDRGRPRTSGCDGGAAMPAVAAGMTRAKSLWHLGRRDKAWGHRD